MNEEERMGHRIYARQRWQPSRFAQERMKTHSGIAGISCPRAEFTNDGSLSHSPLSTYLN